MTRTIGIIGGGISGLVAAYRLRQALGRDVHLLMIEAQPRIGGKLYTQDLSTGPVDMGAEAYLARRPEVTDLVHELGLGEKLRYPANLPSVIYAGGRTHPMPAGTLMGIPTRAEHIAGLVDDTTLQRVRAEADRGGLEWTPGEDRTIGDLVTSRFGQEVTDKCVDPLLVGVYSTRADKLSVRACIPALAAVLDRQAGSPEASLTAAVGEVVAARRGASYTTAGGAVADRGAKPEPVFACLAGGYRTLYDTLREVANPTVLQGSPVEAIYRLSSGRFHLEPIGDVDAVVLATPAPVAARLLRAVAPEAAQAASRIPVASSAVVGMRYTAADAAQIPDYTGVLIGTGEDTTAKAFTFASRKWPHLVEQAGHLVRASFGHLSDPQVVDLSHRELVTLARRDLHTVAGVSAAPVEVSVVRWHGGLPAFVPGTLAAQAQIAAAVADVPGLAVTGAYLDGVGVPACVASATEAAARLVASLH